MRVLVATTAGSGHFGPLVPFARALVDRGHDVVVAAPASFAAAVDRAGFVHQPFADAPAEGSAPCSAACARSATTRPKPSSYARCSGASTPGPLCRRCRPSSSGGGRSWSCGSRASSRRTSQRRRPACPTCRSAWAWPHSRTASPGWSRSRSRRSGGKGAGAGLRSVPRLSLVPPTFEDPSAPGLALLRFRADAASAAGGPLPDWWRGVSGPLVYVTFGSVAANLGLPGLYRAAAAVLAGLPIRVLLTVGDAGDPALIGSLPDNVHVETWWPQQDVMAHAAAMVGHGGFGTTLIGLAAGIPMVVVPLFADQPYNARRVHDLGAGIALDDGPGAPAFSDGSAAVDRLAGAVERVLGEASTDW